ncbi:MAG: hypothetical protein ACXWLR_14815 [Myxococcales bacterium]
MAMYDPILAGSNQFQGHSDVRYDRGLRISWSGVVAGTAIGWALFSLIGMLGAAIGLAKFDPTSANPANGLGAGSGIFGVVALLVSSIVGAYLAVRIAGDRRRSEALLHGAICWAFSLIIGAMLALGAARPAAPSAATVAAGPRVQARAERESNARRNSGPTPADRSRAEEASDAAAKTTGGAAGGAFLGLVGSMIGALGAARRRTAKNVSDGMEKRKPDDSRDVRPAATRRDQAIIVPPEA